MSNVIVTNRLPQVQWGQMAISQANRTVWVPGKVNPRPNEDNWGRDFPVAVAARDTSNMVHVRTFKTGSGIVNDVEYKNLTVEVTFGDPPQTTNVNVTDILENERKSSGDWIA